MGSRLPAVLTVAVILLVLASIIPLGASSVSAATEPSGPDRFSVITQDYTAYTWWLTDWGTNKVACSLEVDHEGLPMGGEIYDSCGKTIYTKWIGTGTCGQDGDCGGYYLQLISSAPASRKVSVKLQPPVVWVSLDGCIPFNSTFRCDRLPSLVLTGEEPLDGEHITSVEGNLNGREFTCDPICQVDLVPTGDDGINISFWAFSSYGNSSNTFTVRVRVIPADDASGHFWYADVLSTQWQGVSLAGGSMTWDVFPPIGGVPPWLATPASPTDLATSIPYEYLAAHLLRQGIADSSNCLAGGLMEDGSASTCGLEAALPAVTDWQNRFDELIFTAAQTTGIPAQLLKNIFARESQFWPGIFNELHEAGLGQLTVGGADTTLLWNRPFFEQFCPSILDDAICSKGYAHIQPEQQMTLDEALVKSVDAFCQDCPLGIDLDRADNSVAIFAETILANSEQAGMIVFNTYGASPGNAASYEDLWRFTMVNYNAGPGCLTLAMRDTRDLGETLDWEHLSQHFTPVCQPALDYVNSLTGINP